MRGTNKKNRLLDEVDLKMEKDAYRKFNNIFALICMVTMLVFIYLAVVEFKITDILLGVHGLIIALTIVVCVLGYAYGYILIKGLLRKIIKYAMETRKKDYLKTIFISIISHDLRNFLGAIGLSLQNVKDGYLGPVNERQVSSFNDAQEAIDRMERMTTGLVDITRMETGVTRLQRTEFKLAELIDSQIEKIRHLVDEKRIKVSCNVEKDLFIFADKAGIAKVFYNLLHNSARHTPVDCSIFVNARPEGQIIRAEVVNEGKALPAEELRYLFEGFSQRPDSYFEIKDYGLGLAVARSVINLHGGQIWMENRQGVGCVYAFTVPNKKGS
ncbi:sensor histidine kinase [Candidatus Omnitrophota bacterium]